VFEQALVYLTQNLTLTGEHKILALFSCEALSKLFYSKRSSSRVKTHLGSFQSHLFANVEHIDIPKFF
jgi:hypothetical protein